MNFKWKYDKEYMAIIKDLINTDEVQSLKNFKHHKKSNRFEHVVQVSYKSYKIAKFLGLDYESTARGGLLHDLYFIQGHYHDRNHGHAYWHPRIALDNASKITTLNCIEKDIILKHMFGATTGSPNYRESWIVNLVDDVQALDDIYSPIEFQIIYKLIQQKPMIA